MVVANTLVKVACKRLQCTEAELARDHLKVDKQRLYQWKTYRRKIPTGQLYHLITLAGGHLHKQIGQYQIEWSAVKSQRTRGAGLAKTWGLQKGGR